MFTFTSLVSLNILLTNCFLLLKYSWLELVLLLLLLVSFEYFFNCRDLIISSYLIRYWNLWRFYSVILRLRDMRLYFSIISSTSCINISISISSFWSSFSNMIVLWSIQNLSILSFKFDWLTLIGLILLLSKCKIPAQEVRSILKINKSGVERKS